MKLSWVFSLCCVSSTYLFKFPLYEFILYKCLYFVHLYALYDSDRKNAVRLPLQRGTWSNFKDVLQKIYEILRIIFCRYSYKNVIDETRRVIEIQRSFHSKMWIEVPSDLKVTIALIGFVARLIRSRNVKSWRNIMYLTARKIAPSKVFFCKTIS